MNSEDVAYKSASSEKDYVVLTGFNTDIDNDGTTYHVQTEDKGRTNPFVESLVYARGEILYSRRTPYHDLVEQDVNPKAVASLMERQHRTIVEAIRRGRLAQLTGKAEDIPTEEDTAVVPPAQEDKDDVGIQESPDRTLDQVILDYLAAQRGKAHLVLRAKGDQDFIYGNAADVEVNAVDSHTNGPLPGVRVTVLFKSTAEPRRVLLAEGETGEDGIFTMNIEVPDFNGGTSAVVITGESTLGQTEIKHLVHR